MTMLEKFDELSLIPSMQGIAAALEQCDMITYQQLIGSLGESACYIAAGRLAKVCRSIEECKCIETAKEMYPVLIEEAIRLRVYVKIVLTRMRSENCYNGQLILEKKDSNVAIASGFETSFCKSSSIKSFIFSTPKSR